MEIIQPGLTYLTREDWGARTDIPRLGYPVNRLDRTEAIMHHTVIIDNDATPNLWETMAEVRAKMVQLQTIRPELGLDVPYNFVAFHMADGSLIVCEGRGLDLTGAHTHGHNTRGVATAGEGNFQIGQSVAPYADLWSTWWGHLKYYEGMENLGSVRPTAGPNVGAIAFGHIDLAATSCPGLNLYTIIPQLTFKEDDMALTTAEEQAIRFIIAEHEEGGSHYDSLTDLFKRVDAMKRDIDSQIAEHKAGGGHFNALDELFPRVKTLEERPAGGVSPEEARGIAKEEDNKLHLAK